VISVSLFCSICRTLHLSRDVRASHHGKLRDFSVDLEIAKAVGAVPAECCGVALQMKMEEVGDV
jgi:hypothetical protein